MAADTGFKYSYDSGVINRFDIYIPAGKVHELIPEKLLSQLLNDKIVNLSSLTDDYPKTNNSLNKLLKRLEKPKSKSLCAHLESFIQSVTVDPVSAKLT